MKYKNKLSIYSGFLVVNILFSIVIASRYFFFMPEIPSGFLGPGFIISSLIGQMALLGGVVGVLGLIVTLLPKRSFYFFVSALAAITLSVLVIDTFVFSQYRFHINEVVLKLILSGDVVDFSIITWLTAIIAFFGLFLFELLIIVYLGRLAAKNKMINKKGIVSFFVFSFLICNSIHIWAAANAYQPVMIVKNYLPLFQPATANGLMQRNGWIDEEALAQQRAMSIKVNSDLNYPLSEIGYSSVDKPINIMFLVIDSWRFDTFNAENTPNLWGAAQKGVIFNHHFSTGNSTRTGIFGLFYGMPGTYWQNMLTNQRAPVFMDRLQGLNYQIGAFASASLMDPEFNRTVFSNISDLRLKSKGGSPSQRDENLTNDWLKWYKSRDTSRPTFSFLFYDAPHGYDFPVNYQNTYEPMLDDINYLALNNEMDPVPFFNRYRTSVRFVDDLSKKVFDALDEAENTVVVITGDHGQEFNDNKQNFWGHNGNFTPAQTQVPFVIIGPGIIANNFTSSKNLSSHEDLVPTLMKKYLGLNTSSNDFSTGVDLLSLHNKERDWLISSSYSAYAMITRNRILEVGASGQYQYLDLKNQMVKSEEPDFRHLKEVLEHLSRFKTK